MGHKAIAIPVSYNSNGPPKFLTVRDRRFKDWTFITGGCRKREILNPIRCALRELSEETRGALRIFEGEYNSFSFNVHLDGEIHTYNVFIFLVHFDDGTMKNIVRDFNTHKAKTENRKRCGLSIRLVQDENDILSWDTLEEFSKKKLWSVARQCMKNEIIQKISSNVSINWVKFCQQTVYGSSFE